MVLSLNFAGLLNNLSLHLRIVSIGFKNILTGNSFLYVECGSILGPGPNPGICSTRME